MQPHRGLFIGCIGSILLSFTVAAGSLSAKKSSSRPSAGSDQPSKLLKHDRMRWIKARYEDRQEAIVLIAVKEGRNAAMVDSIDRLGGRVQFSADDVSYLRVKVPLASVEIIARSPYVEALTLDGGPGYTADVESSASVAPAAQNTAAAPNRETPAENPYLPTRYMGAPQFVARHPGDRVPDTL